MTVILPKIMFIQQEYVIVPALAASKGMATGLFIGSGTVSVSHGMRTAFKHSLSVSRVNSRITGLP